MSSARSGTFGSAKPLPGQSGYKESRTALLEKEALEMEQRLKMLQEQMQQQNEAEEKARTLSGSSDGSRWKSASTKRGSLSSYAKDVNDKIKKQSTKDPSQRATAAARRNQRKLNSSQHKFNNKDVEHWSVADVGEWLTSMLLQEHVQSFANNAISGAILLDVSLEDLDYMNITVLAHRKVILKGIEDLRKNKRVTKQLFAPSSSIQSPPKAKVSTDDGKVGRVTPEKEESLLVDGKPKVHWSTLEPLRMKELTNNDISEGHMINGADSMGAFDEEAERRAFQEAVMAWRQGTSVDEKGGKSLLVQANNGASDQWTNPFGAAKKSSTTTGAGMDQNGDDMVLLSARSHIDIDASNTHSSPPKKSLADGTLDEEKERRAFQAAVDNWRSGADSNVNKSKNMAEKLAQQMDAMHMETAAKMRRDQDSMIERIQKARDDLDVAKRSLQQDSIESDEYDNNSDDVIVGYDFSRNYYGGDDLSPCPSMHDDDDDVDDRCQQSSSFVEVELIQSSALEIRNCDIEQEYFVDEPSSDEGE